MAPNETEEAEVATGERRSLWLETTSQTDYEPLEGRVEVDTAVIGGGIAGISTAFDLVEAGQSVAVIERDRILEAVTGHTTAKLTSLHGLIYEHLIDEFGGAHARQYLRANEAAIDEIESRVEECGIDCEFARVPAYTYTESPDRRDAIRDEVDAARSLGRSASFVEETSLPYDIEAAVRFDDQALFHPRKYLLELARRIPGEGSHIFESTRATDIEDGEPCSVSTDRGEVTATAVVVATHFPFFDRALYFARLYPKRSYVLAVRLPGGVPEGMYYQPDDPYFSVRPHPVADQHLALIGGRNHRTGHGDSTAEHYRTLERQARDRFDVESIEYRWSTQDFVSIDRIPFVGKHAPRIEHVYVATGFGGWGMTNGTAAGRMLADHILGRDNSWSEVFRPTRFNWGASRKALLEHNKHAIGHFLKDHLRAPAAIDARDLDRDSAMVIESNGSPVGVYRDRDGAYHAVSAVCTHMGCLVEWNDGERSWDCPCHGSRFGYDGRVIDTPAVEDLKRNEEALDRAEGED